ncbi:MAG: tetratricopeptide repeat protein [Akkermansiaceae bacterium]
MRRKHFLVVSASGALLAGLFVSCGPGDDVIPLSSQTVQGGSPQANALYATAQQYESAGKTGRAISTYQKIVKKYPHTTVGADARFAHARLLDKQGDLFKAFESYQELISRYPGSKHYAAAVKRQETVAHSAANGVIKNNFLGMKTRISPQKIEKMLSNVRDNAPRAASASKAQLAIGQVWQKEGNAAKAIAAYEQLGRDYGDSPQAHEALFQTGEILVLKSKRGNQNKAHVHRARNIYTDLIHRYPGSNRVADAKRRLTLLGGQDIQRSFEIAEFYRGKGQNKSALFYYREVVRKSSSGALHDKAKRRIAELGG